MKSLRDSLGPAPLQGSSYDRDCLLWENQQKIARQIDLLRKAILPHSTLTRDMDGDDFLEMRDVEERPQQTEPTLLEAAKAYVGAVDTHHAGPGQSAVSDNDRFKLYQDFVAAVEREEAQCTAD